MERTPEDEKILQALKALILNTAVNTYAVESVAFGFDKPGDQAPIDLYLERVQLCFNYEPYMRKDIPGRYIDENERISAEYDYSEYVRELFVSNMEYIFYDAPKDKRLERDGEDLPLPPRFRDHLLGLLPLFAEVLKVDVECDVFDLIPTDEGAVLTELSKWIKFVTAILLKPLRSGSQINRYVKDIFYAPPFIRRLMEKRGDSFYLKPVDIDSYEYAFALFSLMRFKNKEFVKLLEFKMLEWERLHKSE